MIRTKHAALSLSHIPYPFRTTLGTWKIVDISRRRVITFEAPLASYRWSVCPLRGTR